MNQLSQEKKDLLLEERQKAVTRISAEAQEKLDQISQRTGSIRDIIRTSSSAELGGTLGLLSSRIKRKRELESIVDSPFFTRLHTKDFERLKENIYIGKFNLPESHVYSWVSPLAKLRFEELGDVSYPTRSGIERKGHIDEKEDFMIADAKIGFYSQTLKGQDRKLVFQSSAQTHKKGFVLPEVIAQMEKAQDQILRMDAKGPMIISGPAGSGKTTLALHRVAYLMQSPETEELFGGKEAVLVIVQDERTMEYFNGLLPSLGITNVSITTYTLWAKRILGIEKQECLNSYGKTMIETDRMTYEKVKASAACDFLKLKPFKTSPYAILDIVYKDMPDDAKATYLAGKKAKVLDKQDLTVLIESRRSEDGLIMARKEKVIMRDHQQPRRVMVDSPVRYRLVLVDEFENYSLPELELLSSVVVKKTEALILVGDVNQQTQMGTVRSVEDIPIKGVRHIGLQKVYRNTKSILEYIEKRGYSVTIPEVLEKGEAVKEVSSNRAELEGKIKSTISSLDEGGHVGLIAMNDNLLEELRAIEGENLHVLSIHEAQGVEFEHVILVEGGSTSGALSFGEDFDNELESVSKDRLYVGLTRAMKTLEVIKLSD